MKRQKDMEVRSTFLSDLFVDHQLLRNLRIQTFQLLYLLLRRVVQDPRPHKAR